MTGSQTSAAIAIVSLCLGATSFVGCAPQSRNHANEALAFRPANPGSARQQFLRDREHMRHLASQKMAVDFEDTPLRVALQEVSAVADLPVSPEWESLKLVGTEPDLPVTMHLNNASVTTVLSMLRDRANVVSEFDPVDWQVHNGVILFDRDRVLRKHLYSLAYPVADLIYVHEDALDLVHDTDLRKNAQEIRLQLDKQMNPVKYATSGSELFGRSAEPDRDVQEQRRDRMRQLKELIHLQVGDLNTWYTPESSLQFVDGVMVVETSLSNHLAIEQLLEEIRSAAYANRLEAVKQATAMVMLVEAERHLMTGPGGLTKAEETARKAERVSPHDPLVRYYREHIAERAALHAAEAGAKEVPPAR